MVDVKGKGTWIGGWGLNMYNFDEVYHLKNIDSLVKTCDNAAFYYLC